MAGESYAIPPKIVLLRNSLVYQHHQLAGGDRLPAERVLCEEIGVFAYGVARRYHAAHLVRNAREPLRIGYVFVSS